MTGTGPADQGPSLSDQPVLAPAARAAGAVNVTGWAGMGAGDG